MKKSVIVVGAGIAGLSCAALLAEAGLEVRLVDKARGPGGRCSTRRHEGFRFDHGAQYFTARSPGFRRQVEGWQAQGRVDRWRGRLVTIDAAGHREPFTDERDRFVGVPGMNSIAKVMAERLNCQTSSRIVGLQHAQSGWQLTTDAGDTLSSELLVMTPPPAQTAELLGPVSPELAERVEQVVMSPCWALMLGFAENPVDDFDGALIAEQPISWMASSRGKAGREGSSTWVIHASESYSLKKLEESKDRVAAELFETFCRITGQQQAPVEMVAHRWRYAMAAEPLSVGKLVDRSLGLWVAGDWCSGSRIEAAWHSGQAAAADLLDYVRG